MAPLAKGPGTAVEPAPTVRPKETWRDTIESLAVAFILAILFRGFHAEAFVIPTGSMAPTLMGRHKDVHCPQCGYWFTVNASEPNNRVPESMDENVEFATCVNCRFPAQVDRELAHNGDRILVLKFPYEFPNLPGSSPPRRWDVVVFRYPLKPEQNYIKRLVGLPGEEIRIDKGDIYVRSTPDAPFTVARKPWFHLDAMKQLVWDDELQPRAFEGRPEWKRWVPNHSGAWTETGPGTYLCDSSTPAGEGRRITYRHLVPEADDWESILEGQTLSPRKTLITDFTSYNTAQTNNRYRDLDPWMQPHWNGDLILQGRIDVRELAQGDPYLELRLVRAGTTYRCRFDLNANRVQLLADDRPLQEASTASLQGVHDVTYANVDGRLSLRIDGRPVFDEGVPYRDESRPEGPTAADLDPVQVEAGGATVEVSRLKLFRDLYYTLKPAQYHDYDGIWSELPRSASELTDFLSDPSKFAVIAKAEPGEPYKIGEKRYFMMGDNSPRSQDSRAWGTSDEYDPVLQTGWSTIHRQAWEVPETLLVGKAFFIYWPHAVPVWPKIQVNFLGRPILIPFRPYFERMTLIR